jgi:hypothetical protein
MSPGEDICRANNALFRLTLFKLMQARILNYKYTCLTFRSDLFVVVVRMKILRVTPENTVYTRSVTHVTALVMNILRTEQYKK